MKNKILIFVLTSFILTGCVGVGSKGIFGTGVSVALDPRTVGTQIDDSIMHKTISAKILAKDKKYLISVKTKVLDGRIFVTGKVDSPEEKLLITKLAWETKGARSVRNDIKIKEEFNFKQSAKDVLITRLKYFPFLDLRLLPQLFQLVVFQINFYFLVFSQIKNSNYFMN